MRVSFGSFLRYTRSDTAFGRVATLSSKVGYPKIGQNSLYLLPIAEIHANNVF